ncbi:nuclear transport factor 2 family protein [Chitinophaga sp. SYP-B3965]|uniref:nuclear transport factor 2 family protein n=1 Tax=Chitinophaga sp. SYP-B3965 TaxID=2663120 RepID=UPI001299A11C|nr:nuclear transport factor 2 family protein [Chitinophaga sp. SYP-B3965]MRG47908.1 nuclear transport factor 2 family protein [Chitinophaga sp. SYP-B3965]
METIVREFLAAVQRVDLEKIGAILHPEVKWNAPGNNRFSGLKLSVTEVFQMVGGMFEASQNTFALAEIKSVAVNGNKVACLLRFTAARNGVTLDTDNIDVYTVVDGKIVAVDAFATDAAAEDAFWGSLPQ